MSSYGVTRPKIVNTLSPEQNAQHFAESIFKLIFLNEIVSYFDWNSSLFLYSSIRSDNGLVLTRREAIIWNNDG